MKTPSLFKTRDSRQPWQWPSCKHPTTLSFRASNDHIFKTVNSVFLDTSDSLETPESWFANSSDCASTSFSTNGHSHDKNEAVEMIIRDVRSSERRLFFKPDKTSSIINKEETRKKISSRGDLLPFEESIEVALESDNPYLDFKKSMQEMVESHGLVEWDRLEELLVWYLEMNGKHNHGFIAGAFIDVLVGIVKNSALCRSDSILYSSLGSCFSSPPSPLFSRAHLEADDVINVHN